MSYTLSSSSLSSVRSASVISGSFLKYRPFAAIHLRTHSSHFAHCVFRNSSAGIAFITLSSSRRMWYCFPHNSFLRYGNSQKSLRAKSGLYGGWLKVPMNSESRKLCVALEVCDWALSWWSSNWLQRWGRFRPTWKCKVRSTLQYNALLIVVFVGRTCWYSGPQLSKNTVSIILNTDRCWQHFLFVRRRRRFCFKRGSKCDTQLLSWVITLIRMFGSESIRDNHFLQMTMWAFIWSIVRKCGTQVEEMHRIFNWSGRIRWRLLHEILVWCSSLRKDTCQSSWIITETVLTFVAVHTLASWPVCGRSSADWRPSLNSLCHCSHVRNWKHFSPYTFFIFQYVSAGVNPCV